MASISELLSKAAGGDVPSMEELVKYYDEQNNAAEADKWDYHAKASRKVAIMCISIISHAITAYSAQITGGWDAAEEEWRNIKTNAIHALNDINSGAAFVQKETEMRLREYYAKARYGLALVSFARDNNLNGAIEELDAISDKTGKEHALLGLSYFRGQDYEKAYEHLNMASRDHDYISSEKEIYDQAIFAEGMDDLATICRVGLPGLPKDLERSVSILSMAIRSVTDTDFKAHLQEELSRYKKRLFGGYQYK